MQRRRFSPERYRRANMNLIMCNMTNVSTSTSKGKLNSVSFNNETDEMYSYDEITELCIYSKNRLAGPSGDSKFRIPLRKSLFSNVAPYIRFQTYNSPNASQLPLEISHHFKWRRNTPMLVWKTVQNSGFGMTSFNDWAGMWGRMPRWKSLRTSQKVNHFPGALQIGHKDSLWTNLHHMMLIHGKKQFGFAPKTYILPEDFKKFRKAWDQNLGMKWIIKPPASGSGRGIKVVHRWAEIPKRSSVTLVVQQYVDRPKLIEGSKFDLRLYVLVTSFDPLRIYLYSEGLVRFASVKYDHTTTSLNDKYMHLTNCSVNKWSMTYRIDENANSRKGHLWTLRSFWSHLRRERVDARNIWEKIKDIVIKTMIAGEPAVVGMTQGRTPSTYTCYELFGLDILLDENLEPWLLEVNSLPSMESSTPVDVAVKGPMIRNIFNIVGFKIPTTLTHRAARDLAQRYTPRPTSIDPKVYGMALNEAEKQKHNVYKDQRKREVYLQDILETLLPDDLRHLIRSEDELTELGRFERIFPTDATYKYFKFFKIPRYYNMLFDAWEAMYGAERRKGIERLQQLCKMRLHL